MACVQEWIVLVEVTDERNGSTIAAEDVERLVDVLDDPSVSALYHPQRYAIQLSIDAPSVAEALTSALERLGDAAAACSLPRWDLARVEVLSTEEFARELGSDESAAANQEMARTYDRRATTVAEDLLARAFSDSLTGLPTTELFRDRVTTALAATPSDAEAHHHLMVVDLDGFADLNRSRGYAAGDQVLAVIADRLSQAAGAHAEVARIGGDEFAVLVPPSARAAVERLAVRLLDAVAAPVKLAQREVYVTAGLGVASAAGRTADGLLRDASVAMCVAKTAGRGRHRWFQPGLAADLSRLELDVDPAADRLSHVLLVERAAVAANEEGDLAAGAAVVLKQVCAHAGWVASRFCVANAPEVDPVWHATIPERFVRLREALDDRSPNDSGNLPARVEAGREAAWVTDVVARSSPWAREATQVGICAAYCFPVFVGRDVVGTLEFFSPRAVKPDGSLLDVMRSVGFQLGRIVERRRATEALSRLTESYGALAEAVPIMMWRADADGKVNFFNRRWLDFTGRSLDEELGDGWADGIHPDDRDRCLESYRRAVEQRRSFELTYRLLRADGEYRSVLDQGSPAGTAGERPGYVGGAIDVTERYALELELRRNRARFLALLDNSSAVTLVLAADGRIAEEHTGAVPLGYDEGHSHGKVGFEYIHPDDLGRAAERFAEVLSHPGVHPPFECRVQAADGSWRIMESVANNQLENPDIEGIVVTSVDMTERKMKELANVEAEQLARDALALAGVGTWHRHLLSGADDCSTVLTQMLGWDAGGVATGADIEATLHPDDRSRYRSSVDGLTMPGMTGDGVFRVVRPGGDIRWLRARMTAAGVGELVTSILVTFQELIEPSIARHQAAPVPLSR